MDIDEMRSSVTGDDIARDVLQSTVKGMREKGMNDAAQKMLNANQHLTGDVKGLPVERYKMTDEQLEHLKKVQKFQSIRRALEEATLKEQAKFKSLQEMWKAMNQGLKLLAIESPKESTKELPGMDFQSEMEKFTPQGPDELNQAMEETRANPSGSMINY